MDKANRYSPPPARETESTGSSRPAAGLAWYFRLPMVLAGCVLLALLVTAARLQPSSRGFGTHQQLGLPPCTITVLLGMRCPSCGMTTSWSYFTRGRIWQSLKANTGGALLAALSVVVGPWLLLSGLAGHWLWRPPRDTVVLAISLLVLAITIVDWSVRLLLG